jgi:hypothetical protein
MGSIECPALVQAGVEVSWGAWPDGDGYPTKFYQSLNDPAGAVNVHSPSTFIPMAKAGELPQVCYVWSPAGHDEHPPHVSDPAYITNGHDLVWSRVQAVIDGGGWADTTFILTWDGATGGLLRPDHGRRRRLGGPRSHGPRRQCPARGVFW